MDLNDIDLKTWRRYEKIRALYDRHPALYRLRLVLILLYGLTNIFLLLVVLLLLAVIFWPFILALTDGEMFIGVILLVIPAIAVIWIYCYMRRRDIPDGLPVKRGRLFDEVNKVCSELNIPPIRELYLDMGTKAAVFPRFKRMPLVKRDVLVIGCPLICALDAKSFRICLTRVLWHEKRHARDPLLKWIERIWALPPVMYNPDTGEAEKKKLPPWFNVSFFPLRAKEELDGEAYCRDAFGAKDYAAFVTQALFRGRKFDMRTLVIRKSAGDISAEHPAADLLDEVRRNPPEPEMKRILARMLRSSEPVFETLPPFRERVGTDDPAELLPYLLRTADTAETLLLADSAVRKRLDWYLRVMLYGTAYLDKDDVSAYYDPDADASELEKAAEQEDAGDIEPESGKDGEDEAMELQVLQWQKDENIDESCDDLEAWLNAITAAANLLHEDHLRDVLEKAVKKFPHDLSLRGSLLSWHMRHAETAQEESEAAGKLMRITEQDPMLALTFDEELFEYAVHRGDSDLVGHLLEVRETALKAKKKTLSPRLSMDDLLEPCKKFPVMRRDIRKLLSDDYLSVERIYFVTRCYRESSLLRTYFIFLKRSKKKTFLYGDGYPQEFVNYIQESPFVVCEATKNDLKVLEAKHIPFVKIKK
jgi:hypothetical protein